MPKGKNNGEVLRFSLKSYEIAPGENRARESTSQCLGVARLVKLLKHFDHNSKDSFLDLGDFNSWMMGIAEPSSFVGRMFFKVFIARQDDKIIHVFSIEEFIRFLRMFSVEGDGEFFVKRDLTEKDLKSFLKSEKEGINDFLNGFGGYIDEDED